MITASRLEIAAQCPGMAHMEWAETTSARASRGTVIHEFIEATVCGQPVPTVAREHAAVCEALDTAKVAACFDGTPASEVAYAYTPETGQSLILGDHVRREYSEAPEGAICGAADLVEPGRLVMDVKCGRVETRPADLLQLRFLGLAAATASGVDQIAVAIAEVADDGAIWITTDLLDEIELDATRELLREIKISIRRAEENPQRHLVVGGHCQWCPAALHCPAQAASVQALVPVNGRGELTDETVAKAYAALKAAKPVLDRVDLAIRTYVLQHPVPLAGGKELRIVREMHDRIDNEAALRMLTDVYGEDAARRAASVTKASLRRAVPKDEWRGYMTALVEAGAVSQVPVDKMKAVKVTKTVPPDTPATGEDIFA